MRNTVPKQFEKSNLSERSLSSLLTVSSELESDDDDPLSMGNLLITFLGIILASFTILLPSISVLLDRPLSQSSEITLNQSI